VVRDVNVLVLVLSCRSGPFPALAAAARRTWAATPPAGVEVLFYAGGRDLRDEPPELELPVPDDLEHVGLKTLAAFAHVLATRDFDLLFRTNSSSYVELGGLRRFAAEAPRERFYAAVPIWRANERYGSGAGYFLSRDLVELVVAEAGEWEHEAPDDVALGRLVVSHAVELVELVRQDLRLDDPPEYVDPELFHFRCKQEDDRSADVVVMERVHAALTRA
jgi:hypothetical protein